MYASMPPGREVEVVRSVVQPAASVLELGCGTGRLLEALQHGGYQVYGIDFNPEMIAVAQSLGVNAWVGDACSFDAEVAADLVFAPSRLINIVDSPERLILNAVRHMHPNGQLLIEWFHPEIYELAFYGGLAQCGHMGNVAFDLESRRDSDFEDVHVISERYEMDGEVVRNETEVHLYSELVLDAWLANAGLKRGAYLDDTKSWFCCQRNRRAG